MTSVHGMIGIGIGNDLSICSICYLSVHNSGEDALSLLKTYNNIIIKGTVRIQHMQHCASLGYWYCRALESLAGG